MDDCCAFIIPKCIEYFQENWYTRLTLWDKTLWVVPGFHNGGGNNINCESIFFGVTKMVCDSRDDILLHVESKLNL